MTDYESLLKLLDSFGIGYSLIPTQSYMVITMKSGDTKVGGYNGYGTEFTFDLRGKFVVCGAYNTIPDSTIH